MNTGDYNLIMQPFDFSSSPFGERISIPVDAQIIFVADMFVTDYVGGAELTTEALVTSSPFRVFKLRSKDVTMELLREGADRFWVFGNFAELNPQLIPSIIANLRYSVVEYDYKFCRARSPEKHFQITGTPCDCVNQINGKMISAFFYGSMGLWWMSEAQKQRYLTAFPFLSEKDNIVLSSVFDPTTLGLLKALRHKQEKSGAERKDWIVLGSNSWIKGADDAEKWCQDNDKHYEVVWNLPYSMVLEKLSQSEGFVYLPKGGDTCPRMVIEAKLLGCKMHLNESVQHKDEEWFATDDLQEIEDYLFASPGIFWSGIKKMMEYKPTVSGYTTTYNVVKQAYPFKQCIQSMLQFCDEVCIVDGNSTDGTLDSLILMAYPTVKGAVNEIRLIEDIQCMVALVQEVKETSYELPDVFMGHKRDPKIRVKIVPRDWNSKHHPVFDGMQKAAARAMCTKEFCWQMDSDEIVHEDDAHRIVDLCRSIPKGIDIMALPVIEYWGGPEKVRLDIQPWKWRLSRNLPHITHGIPVELRRIDAEGNPYAAEGTDGCDMIHKETGERLGFVSFYDQGVENVRRAAMLGNEQARQQYEQWFNQVVTGLPGVFHYSWYDLPRKIKLYRDYWTKHWVQIAGGEYTDSAEQNMMFDVPWSQVTDVMIEARAHELQQIGGWIWHRKWDGTKTPWITCARSQPQIMKSATVARCEDNGTEDTFELSVRPALQDGQER